MLSCRRMVCRGCLAGHDMDYSERSELFVAKFTLLTSIIASALGCTLDDSMFFLFDYFLRALLVQWMAILFVVFMTREHVDL